jgi:hypothetical protein
MGQNPMEESSAPADFDPQVVAVWAQYAKERCDAHEKRLADQRSWARQLAAGMGVVVGVEAAFMAQLLKLGEAGDSRSAWILSLLFLLGVIGYQLLILARAVRVGYVGQELLGAESPVVLADHLVDKDEAWTRRTIGAYYAKGADNVHAVAEAVAKDVAVVARRFHLSLALLFTVMLLTSGLAAVSSHARKTMADTPASSGSAPSDLAPASQPPAAAPSAAVPSSPLLVTPTPGQTETRGAPPPRETMVSTPTSGQRITEGTDGKRK